MNTMIGEKSRVLRFWEEEGCENYKKTPREQFVEKCTHARLRYFRKNIIHIYNSSGRVGMSDKR